MNGFCHGDDLAEDHIESFGKLLPEKFDTRRMGMTGAAEHLDRELEVLQRCVRVINYELMEIEADQKHVPKLLERSWTHSKQHCRDSESEIEV